MNILSDVLPKIDNQIVLSPGGKVEGELVDGYVSVDTFNEMFPHLATAETPLSTELFTELRAIDKYWAMNAERWRAEGLI